MTVYRIPMPSLLREAFPNPTVRSELARAMGDVFSNGSTVNGHAAVLPPTDLREDASGFTFELDVPGVAPEGIEVLAEEQVLTIRGTRGAKELGADERQVIAERLTGGFERRFRLPKSADRDGITASYAHGVLTVRVAKVTPTQPKRVTVEVSTSRE